MATTEIEEGIRDALRLQESVLVGLLGDAVYGKFVAVKATWAATARQQLGASSSISSFIDWLLAFTDNDMAVEVNLHHLQDDRQQYQQHGEEVQIPQRLIKNRYHQQQTRPMPWTVRPIKTESCVGENDFMLSGITRINSREEIPILTDAQSVNGPCQASSTISPSPPIPSTTSPSPLSAPTLPTASSLPACSGLTFYRCTVCDFCLPQKPDVLNHIARAHGNSRHRGTAPYRPGGKGSIRGGRTRKYNVHELAAQPDVTIIDVTVGVDGNVSCLEQLAVEEDSDTHSMQDGNVRSTVITADSEDDIAVGLELGTTLDTSAIVSGGPGGEPWPQVSSHAPGVSHMGPAVGGTEPAENPSGSELNLKVQKGRPKKKRFSCRYCSFTTKSAASRRCHEVQKHRQMIAKAKIMKKHKAAEPVKYGNTEKKSLECSMCRRQFIYAGSLRNHELMYHGVAKFRATGNLNHSGVQTERDNMKAAPIYTRSKKSHVKSQQLSEKRVRIQRSKNIKVKALGEIASPAVRLQDVSFVVREKLAECRPAGHNEEVEGTGMTFSCPHCPGRRFARLKGLHIHQSTYHKGGKRMTNSGAGAVALSDAVGVMQDMTEAIAADSGTFGNSETSAAEMFGAPGNVEVGREQSGAQSIHADAMERERAANGVRRN